MGIMDFICDDLTEKIIKCIINVHQELGSGFLENVYRKALIIELISNGLNVEAEKEIQLFYKGHEIGIHRLDILVNNQVILELKTVESLNRNHYAQIKSYLKATCLNTGLLVNFSGDKADFRRIIL
jgi:GxxExxY protein